jgi:dTDP-4-amino-4,6-dideoxygalactose transaminase
MLSKKIFLNKNLLSPNYIPEEGIRKAEEVLNSGILYRYTCERPEESEVSMLEKEFADYIGAKFALAVNSCGSAIYISLLSVGVKNGDDVLLSSFTYTAVPSAIVHAGANPILVECNDDYCVDIDDLKRKITSRTKVFILSHMRGHISDMYEVKKVCEQNNIILIEDCAHTVGAFFDGIHTGKFGKVGCFSTQSHKLMNSGEGGILITDDEEIIAKVVLYSGSQETFWRKHFVSSDYLPKLQEYIPNFSLRMSNLTACIIRSQIKYIDDWVEQYIRKYKLLCKILSTYKNIFIPAEDPRIKRGPDTIQFNLVNCSESQLNQFCNILNSKGINIKAFGSLGNPRYYKSWKYINNIEKIELPKTDSILKYACDIRLPLWLNDDDIVNIGQIILDTVDEIKNNVD